MLAKKKTKPTVILADTFFYVIPLIDCEFAFTRDMLEMHYPIPKGRKLYYSNHVDYVSYNRSIVTVSVKLNNGSINLLYLHVEPDALHVACICGMPDDNMCLHAYIGLYNTAWTHVFDLKPFYWPEYDSNEHIQARFLDVDERKTWIFVKPRPQFGNLFRPVVGFDGPISMQALAQPLPAVFPLQGSREVITFCIGYGRGSRWLGQLPALIACQAQTSIDNTSLQRFKEVNGVSEQLNLPAIHSSQLSLIDLPNEMREHLISLGSGKYDSYRPEHRAIKSALLMLWEKALPQLVIEPYTNSFIPYKLTFKNGKAVGLVKGSLRPCRLSLLRPVLYLILKDHKDHLSLSANLSINGTKLKVNHKTHLFVLDQDTYCFYLIDSVEADDLLNWVYATSNRPTILKPHFTSFRIPF
jgi:hypothetical protein